MPTARFVHHSVHITANKFIQLFCNNDVDSVIFMSFTGMSFVLEVKM